MIESGVHGLPFPSLRRSPALFFLAWLGLGDGALLVDAGALVPLRQSFSERVRMFSCRHSANHSFLSSNIVLVSEVEASVSIGVSGVGASVSMGELSPVEPRSGDVIVGFPNPKISHSSSLSRLMSSASSPAVWSTASDPHESSWGSAAELPGSPFSVSVVGGVKVCIASVVGRRPLV